MKFTKNRICSEKGRTNGPNVVKLFVRPSPATGSRSLESATPSRLFMSSF